MNIIKKLVSWLRRPKRYWQIFWQEKRLRPGRIMEIGTWTGDRALTMIKIASRYHMPSEIEYYGFDLFEDMTEKKFVEEKSKLPPTKKEAFDKLSATGASINLFQGDTTKVLPEIAKNLPKMDLIFIDGGHSLGTIANDWKYASQLMHSKTELYFDDYWPDRTDAGAKVTVDGIDRNKYHVKLMVISDYFKKTDFGPLKIKLAKVMRTD